MSSLLCFHSDTSPKGSCADRHSILRVHHRLSYQWIRTSFRRWGLVKGNMSLKARLWKVQFILIASFLLSLLLPTVGRESLPHPSTLRKSCLSLAQKQQSQQQDLKPLKPGAKPIIPSLTCQYCIFCHSNEKDNIAFSCLLEHAHLFPLIKSPWCLLFIIVVAMFLYSYLMWNSTSRSVSKSRVLFWFWLIGCFCLVVFLWPMSFIGITLQEYGWEVTL